jgi:hypothetical protein
MIMSNSPTEVRVTRRKRLLTEKYSTALGGIEALDQHQRADIGKAATLVVLLELAWVNGGGADWTLEDEAEFMRLGKAASEAVIKLGLPAMSMDPALSFNAAVDGLVSKSAGPLGITFF